MSIDPEDNARAALIEFYSDTAQCKCGNTPEAQGFFPCSQGGSYMEPLAETWLGYYRCDRCGAVGHPEEKEVLAMKHTPGPWACDIGERNGEYIIPQIETHLDSLEYYPPDNKFDETEEANARLIAAAPRLANELNDLLNAVYRLFDDESSNSMPGWLEGRVIEARLALEEALGEDF